MTASFRTDTVSRPDETVQGGSDGDSVKPAPFAYAKARTLEHAIELLGDFEDARVLAGGQSLLPMLNMRVAAPGALVDINGVAELAGIRLVNGMVEIGALTRHAQAERSPVIAAHAPLLARALPHVGHAAIRNRGTIGGSIAFADPAAELPACFLALGGEAEVVGPAGRRVLPADSFFTGLFETALGPRDILTAIRVAAAGPGSRIGFDELARRHGDYAMVGLAATAQAAGNGIEDTRLAFFGVGATPVRARGAEAALVNGIEAAVAALDDELDPEPDLQAGAAAKKHLAKVLLRRVAAQLALT